MGKHNGKGTTPCFACTYNNLALLGLTIANQSYRKRKGWETPKATHPHPGREDGGTIPSPTIAIYF